MTFFRTQKSGWKLWSRKVSSTKELLRSWHWGVCSKNCLVVKSWYDCFFRVIWTVWTRRVFWKSGSLGLMWGEMSKCGRKGTPKTAAVASWAARLLRFLGRGKLQLMMMAGKGHVPVVPPFRSWFTRDRMLGELPPPAKKKHIYIRNLFKFAEQNMQVKVKVMMKFNERIGGGGDFFCKHGISR